MSVYLGVPFGIIKSHQPWSSQAWLISRDTPLHSHHVLLKWVVPRMINGSSSDNSGWTWWHRQSGGSAAFEASEFGGWYFQRCFNFWSFEDMNWHDVTKRICLYVLEVCFCSCSFSPKYSFPFVFLPFFVVDQGWRHGALAKAPHVLRCWWHWSKALSWASWGGGGRSGMDILIAESCHGVLHFFMYHSYIYIAYKRILAIQERIDMLINRKSTPK